jgi:two-component system, OmpR family, phosphate regulon sensor histidine kinase PhoR
VREAAQAMEYQMLQEGLRLSVEIDESLPPLVVDRDAMTHAVLNLLSNAVKFSPDGGDVELRLERSNGSACITVTDTGVGISPADQTRIFEEYYRAPDADARGIAGTGLGLALVAGVARAHGGEVEVRSEPGEGSSFTLRIPLEAQP